MTPNHINFLRKDGNPNTNLSSDSEAVEFLKSVVSDTRTYAEAVYCYVNGLTQPPQCICGQLKTFKSFKKGHSPFCSTQCANKNNSSVQSTTKSLWSDDQWANIRAKYKASSVEKYGVEYCAQSDLVKKKIRDTVSAKYGVDHSSQRHFTPSTIFTINSQTHLNNLYNSGASISSLAWDIGCSATTLQRRFRKYGIKAKQPQDTKPETIIQSILDDCAVEYVKKDRQILNGLELDFYIPSLNLAIEYNGVYYHSFDKVPTAKQKNKHFHKFNECQKSGIELIQLTGEKWDVFRTFLLAKTGNIPKIHARKCTISTIDSQSFAEMLNKYHLQGNKSCKVKLGMFYQDQLVAVMGFNSNQKYQWELSRMVFGNCRVIGGASKMLKHFITTHNPQQIVSYSSNAYSCGNVYKALGFIDVSQQNCDLWYVKNGQLINRQKLQKHKLINILEDYNPLLTEQQNLLNNGYRIYFGPGTKTWVLHQEKLDGNNFSV